MPIDQIAAVHSLLTTTPNTRAAFLTTWRGETDSGIESGRPCLVGVTFRAVGLDGAPMSCTGCGTDAFYWKRYDGGGACSCGKGSWSGQGLPFTPLGTLHMTVTFRSHDMHGAYPLNIAALCLWLCEEAKSLGMAVGTLTCMSQSAHVYERDYNAASAKVDAHKWPAIEWDQRSTWRVEVYETEDDDGGTCYYAPFDEFGDGIPSCDSTGVGSYLLEGEWRFYCTVEEHQPHPSRMLPLPKVKAIRAVCLTPSGDKVTAVFEGRTASGLLQEIERSGLISSIGNALWLGGELVKAEAKL